MSSTANKIKNLPLQELLDKAIKDDLAPGLEAVVFDRDGILFKGSAGKLRLGSEANADGVPLTTDSLHWLASCSKVVACILAVQLLDNPALYADPDPYKILTWDDLDNHDKLAHFLPEIAQPPFTHVFDGPDTFTADGAKDTDGRRNLNVRPARKRITLAQILTHSTGIGYTFNGKHHGQMAKPSDGSTPHFAHEWGSGSLDAFIMPTLAEPGELWHYGPNTDWAAQFAIRASGKNYRTLLKERIFEPLGIPADKLDIFRSPEMVEQSSSITVRTPQGWIEIPFGFETFHADPPPGKAHLATAGLWGSLPAYSELLRAILNQDSRIMSADAWKRSYPDALSARGTKRPEAVLLTVDPMSTNDLPSVYQAASGGPAPWGMNLLQLMTWDVPLSTGRPAGTFGWLGLGNTYYFIDPVSGIGGVISAQVLPFADSNLLALRDSFEQTIYQAVKA